MKFRYHKQEFFGPYKEIKRQLKKYLKSQELWLIVDTFELCEEKYPKKQSAHGMDMVKNILITKALARIPTPEEYFDSNAEILFVDGIVKIVVDGEIVGSADDYIFYKQLQEIKEEWINGN